VRNKLHLHRSAYHLKLYQKGVYYISIKIFSELPEYVAGLVVNKKCFISTLKKYLVNTSFYLLWNLLLIKYLMR